MGESSEFNTVSPPPLPPKPHHLSQRARDLQEIKNYVERGILLEENRQDDPMEIDLAIVNSSL